MPHTWCGIHSLQSSTVFRIGSRRGTIHRCIDISRYFSRDKYRDIIFYNRDFLFFIFIYIIFVFHNDFHLGRKDT